ADHTTADDARRYRDDEELERWRARDPLRRLSAHLRRLGEWSEAAECALTEELEARVEAAVAEYLATPPRPPETMFDHLFARLPAALAEQRATLAARRRDA